MPVKCSRFSYQPAGHIITGNLSIIKTLNLNNYCKMILITRNNETSTGTKISKSLWALLKSMLDKMAKRETQPVECLSGLIRKEGNVLFNDALNTFYFTVIWRRTYGKGPLR